MINDKKEQVIKYLSDYKQNFLSYYSISLGFALQNRVFSNSHYFELFFDSCESSKWRNLGDQVCLQRRLICGVILSRWNQSLVFPITCPLFFRSFVSPLSRFPSHSLMRHVSCYVKCSHNISCKGYEQTRGHRKNASEFLYCCSSCSSYLFLTFQIPRWWFYIDDLWEDRSRSSGCLAWESGLDYWRFERYRWIFGLWTGQTWL